jgi:ElaB/YqjD/DUF883 family membrane-anchored ribosome-binding protein
MQDQAKSAQQTAEDTLGAKNVADFQAQLAALRADLAALGATLAAMSKTGSETARQAASDAYAEMKAKGGDTMAEAEAALDGVADYARKNPLQSLGIAAGLGMMLGLLFGRR